MFVLARADKTVLKSDDGVTEEIDIEEKKEILLDSAAYGHLDKSFHSVEKRAAYKYKFLKEMNSPKTVEMLVVVDKNMYHKHGDANVTTYTLTLFNMVST